MTAVRLHLPGALRGYAAGQRLVEMGSPAERCATVGELLEVLRSRYPGVHDRVVDELGSLRPHVNLYVNGESIRYLNGLATPLREGDEVWLLPAISGG